MNERKVKASTEIVLKLYFHKFFFKASNIRQSKI